MSTESDKSPPPGAHGLPLLGETLPFMKNSFQFVAERLHKNGPIFKTHLLGKPTIVISGPEAAALFADQSKVQREGSQPDHIRELFGARGLPHLDGEEHHERKRLVLQAFTREALSSYLPGMQTVIERTLKRWSSSGEVLLVTEFKQMAIEIICKNILGLEEGPELSSIAADTRLSTEALGSLPIPLPGSTYKRGRSAVDRLLDLYE